MNERRDSPPSSDCWNHIGVRGDRSCDKLTDKSHCRHCDVYTESARNIMRRNIPEGYLQDWAAYFAVPEATAVHADQSALVFRIGREWLSLPARLAVTIADPTNIHRLPHRSGTTLLGIVNIRGKLYPCMSLASLMGIDMQEPPVQPGRRIYPRMLVMQLEQRIYALPVQDLYGIYRYAENDLEPPPDTIASGPQRYLRGILRMDGLRIGCLDAQLVGYQLADALR